MQNPIVKSITVQSLSGSTSWLDVSEMDLSRGTIALYGSVSGSYELQGTFDQSTLFTAVYGISGSTGAGAAVALRQLFPPNYATAPSASFMYVRLSNARFGQNAMAGALTGVFVASPYLPSP